MTELKKIDLRSDTVTRPSNEMRQIMATADVGDDVYGEDPSINELEERAAEILDKEAALFLPSGTMGNQVALLTHTSPGQEIILGDESHIFYYEVGGLARLGSLQARTVSDEKGYLEPAAVEHAIRGENIHYPETALICMENTHNRRGGVSYGPDRIKPIAELARSKNIPLHLDGARIFNAAYQEEIEPGELVADFDSVMFCLSKGLGAPVGSMLVGSKEFIKSARKNRKLLGGGMRQAGIIAAAGLYALENRNVLKADHQQSKELAEIIEGFKSDQVEVFRQSTNFVMLQCNNQGGAELITEKLNQAGILTNQFSDKLIRLVTHQDLEASDLEIFRERMETILKKLK
ncbi:MAG: low-specificity L-threonine aldolase [Halanaerobiaceae bacterium]